MSGLLLLNIAVDLVVLYHSYNQAMHNALGFYPSTLLTMFHAGIGAGVAFIGLFAGRLRFVFLLASSIALMSLPVSCLASGLGYPGGDDGGGFGWLFYVGLSSLLAAVVGAVTAGVGLWLRARSRRPHSGAPGLSTERGETDRASPCGARPTR